MIKQLAISIIHKIFAIYIWSCVWFTYYWKYENKCKLRIHTFLLSKTDATTFIW